MRYVYTLIPDVASISFDVSLLPIHSIKVSTLSETMYSDAHRGFIYSLSWSKDSQMISTASADGLVKYVVFMHAQMYVYTTYMPNISAHLFVTKKWN